MPENVDICRLCLSKEGLMLPIFRKSISKNEIAFRFKIMSCTSVEVFADDNLPSKVCYICVHQVEKFFQFQSMCGNSDSVLRSRLKGTNDSVNDASHNNENNKSVFKQDYCKANERLSVEKTPSVDVSICFVCSSVCNTNEQLIDHLIKTHPFIDSFLCKGCKISFSNVNQFKNHLNLGHCLTCDHCDYVFKHQKSLEDHLKSHSGEKIPCKHCEKVFDNVDEVKNHELIHSEKTCRYCLKEFDSNQEYYLHIKQCDQKYHCKFCNESLKLKKDLIQHVNNTHDSVHICSNCQKNFTNLEEVQQHKCEISLNESLQCKNLQACFTDKSSLLNHISVEHSGDMLSCRFCTKKFSLKSSLRRHEKSHSGLKPYQCKFCPRKFKDSSTCIVHTRTHTGEHPFQCQECHKDFKQLANLKMHTYRHHKKNQKPVEGEKTKVLNQTNADYEHLYGMGVVESYSGINTRSYQPLNDCISSCFNSNMNVLISDER